MHHSRLTAKNIDIRYKKDQISILFLQVQIYGAILRNECNISLRHYSAKIYSFTPRSYRPTCKDTKKFKWHGRELNILPIEVFIRCLLVLFFHPPTIQIFQNDSNLKVGNSTFIRSQYDNVLLIHIAKWINVIFWIYWTLSLHLYA